MDNPTRNVGGGFDISLFRLGGIIPMNFLEELVFQSFPEEKVTAGGGSTTPCGPVQPSQRLNKGLIN
jgi:hypothetical protein